MLEVRILGNQPEPSLVEDGMNIVDFEVRTRDEGLFIMGKNMIESYVELNPELEGCQLYISDPMTVGLYPSHDENGDIYAGPVHQMGSGVWMSGRFHGDLDREILLERVVLPNTTVQDFRNVKDIDKNIVDEL